MDEDGERQAAGRGPTSGVVEGGQAGAEPVEIGAGAGVAVTVSARSVIPTPQAGGRRTRSQWRLRW